MTCQIPLARLLVAGIQALTPEAGEQGPAGRSLCRLIIEWPSQGNFLCIRRLSLAPVARLLPAAIFDTDGAGKGTAMARSKNCVLLVSPPADWKPTHFHQVPLEVTTARFYARCVKLHEAMTLALHFNKKHLPCTGNYAGQWAMVTVSLRRNCRQEGGAA